MELAVFLVLAGATLAAAVAAIAFPSPLRSALSLVVCLFSLAGIFATLQAHFLAAMQVIVYVGAVMVLFVFVVMLLHAKPAPDRFKGGVLAGLSAFVVLVLAGKLMKVLVSSQAGLETDAASVGAGFGSTGSMGEMLLAQFLLPFELTSILLLVAVVGAVVIARKRFWRERA
jgi:NADH-quinone oxidoreductase subunit J